MRTVVTGVAGFVGSHLAEALLAGGHEVAGIDAFIDYYPRPVKERNIAGLVGRPGFTFHEADLRTAQLEPLLTDLQHADGQRGGAEEGLVAAE